ncbi:ATP-binding protein [Kitasatospora sp. NPDC001175]|uniref:ATP-binding protein n=1 Tax=Kitasatospora sp. NPDC001175 TaxID=3157103 RepID=UPI003CFC5AE0
MHSIVRFRGVPEAPGVARKMVRDTLGAAHPKFRDVELIVSELTTNAVLHSRSGEDGYFWVEIGQWGDRLRIAVFDEGPAKKSRTGRPADEVGFFGRGLTIVFALADEWGHNFEGQGAQSLWVELASPAEDLPQLQEEKSTPRGV